MTFTNKKYTRMLIACFLGWVVTLVSETADSIMAGIFLGEEAVAAVELVAPVFSLLYFIASFLAIGTAVVFSRAAGEFDLDKSKKTCGMGMLAALVCGIVLACLMFVCEDFYFNFYSSGPAIDELGREYYDCFKILTVIYPAYWVFYYLVNADGGELNVLFVDIFSAICNIGLSILLVKKIGIYGLGIGSALTTLLSMGILVIHLFRKSNGIKFKFYFNWKDFKECLSIGSTSSLTMLYIAIIDILMNKYIIMKFGDEYLAAYAVVNFVINIGACFSCGITSASPFISVAYGEKNSVAMKRIIKMTTKWTVALSVGFVLVSECFATALPDLFGVTNPMAYEASVYAGRLLSISYIAIGLVYEFMGYFPLIEKFLLGNILGINYMLIAPIVFVLPLAALAGWNGLVWGFFLTPFAAILFEIVIMLIKYGKENFPYIIRDTEDKIFIYELALNDKEIVQTKDAVIKELTTLGIDPSIINKVAVTIEETFEIVKEKNKGKRILADCTVKVSKEDVTLTTRDDGVIFDITNSDAKVDSLGAYVAGRIMQTSNERAYVTAISYNRNNYVWRY